MNRALSRLLVFVLFAGAGFAGNRHAAAAQFPVIDPTYTQQIFTGTTPMMGIPGAWTTGGNLLSRDGANVLEYNPTQNLTIQGTPIHGVLTTHVVSGLASGFGMTNGLNGYIYAVSSVGLQRIDPSNWAAPAVTLPGTFGGAGYGVCTLPDGRIAYSDGSGSSNVWIYNPSTSTNTQIYSVANLIDGMVSGPTGDIAVTNHSSPFAIQIIDSTGNVLNSFSTGAHAPDGMAFADSPSASILYSNNNDGTISKYTFPLPGYLGTPTISLIASGSQAYGDLATVGPDCAFYITQYDNFGQNGSTAGIGTHWDNNVTTNDPSIIRIGGGLMRDGITTCQFYSPLESLTVPEPASLSILIAIALPVLHGRRPRRET